MFTVIVFFFSEVPSYLNIISHCAHEALIGENVNLKFFFGMECVQVK